MSSTRRPASAHAAGLALSLTGGALWALCFQAEPRTWAALLAWIPFFLLLDHPRAVFFTWLGAFVGWLGALPWVAFTVSRHGGLPDWVGAALLTGLCAALAVEQAVIAWAARRWSRPSSSDRLWLVPALWVLAETQRGFMVGGFPWNLAAYAWIDVPGALESTAWIGASGLSFVVVFFAGTAASAWRHRRPLPLVATGVVLAIGLVCVRAAAPEKSTTSSFDVRIVQPDGAVTYDRQVLLQSYDRLMSLSDEACDRPALLVWPESAAWPYAWDESPRLRRDVEALNRRGCGVLMSSPRRHGDQVFNSALLHYPSAETREPAEYAKRRLVPWGEYVPARRWFPFIDGLARNVGDFTPGTDVALLPWQEHRLAMAVCYEVIFPSLVSGQTRAGADVLSTITNDAWYGDSAAPWQHLRAARFRAAETRRPMLRAALTGVSAVIDARGRVEMQLGIGEIGILKAQIQGGAGLTPYARAPYLAPLLAAVAVAFAMIRRLRPAPTAASPRPDAEP